MIGKSLFIGDTVELTEIDPEKDAAVLSDWSAYPQFSRKIFFQPFRLHPVHEIKKKFKELLKEADEHHEAIYFALRKPGDARLLGMGWFEWIDGTNQSSSIRFFFDPASNLDGYHEEALRMLMRYAFMELSSYRIKVNLGGDEPEAISLLEKLGFLRAVQRREAIYSEGRFFDGYVYELMKSEWKQKYLEGAK